MNPRTHYLPARHAAKEGDTDGCKAHGTVRVSLNIDDVDCPKCRHWYWHCEGVQLSAEAQAYVNGGCQ